MKVERSILILSNKPEQYETAITHLRDEGFRVRVETKLGNCTCFFDGETPKLIISELAVPDIDGLKLCKSIRKDISLGTTPILLVGDLSRHSSIVSDALRCGANDYFQKPLDDRQLLHACRSMVGHLDKFETYDHWKVDKCLVSEN